jgi:beta-lactamase superfamily II metal-dependent hydrolase
MIKIKFLKAHNGDSILINYDDKNGIPKNILIDGGTTQTYFNSSLNQAGELKKEIESIKKRNESIDLLILTHIDDDHICGLLHWFEKDKDAYKIIKNVWFNSGKLIAEYFREPENPDLRLGLKIFNTTETGVRKAVEFEDYLIDNKIWDRKLILQGDKVEADDIQIQVLSPNKKQLFKLLKEFRKVFEGPAYTSGKTKDWNADLINFTREEESNNFKFKEDDRPNNGSSITFILTIQNRKFLFLADGHPTQICEALKELGYSKEKPLEVELLKVSHHGSKKNTSKQLLELIQTDNYIISTNSSGDGHPNKRTLARIIANNPNAILHFNYENVKDGVINKQDFLDFKHFKIKLTTEINF